MYIPHAITRSGESTMRATICKWGNSLGLRIPRGLAEDAGLTEGSVVELRLEDGRLVAEPVAVEKLDAYQSIASLEAYLIVDHRRRRVERHSRDAHSGEWRREEIVGDGRVRVPCLDVELTLDEIYERVELPAVGEPEPAGYEVPAYDVDADE